jgi:hypothetical protein
MIDDSTAPDSFFLYSGKDRKVPIQCRISDETIWLTQKQLSELFDVGVPAINKHLKNVFETGELEEDSVVSIMEITAADGKKYKTKSYNLDLASNRAQRGIVMQMKDWSIFMNQFLELSNYPILTDNGKISAHKAQLKAEEQYESFRKVQDLNYESDFDMEVRRIQGEHRN